MADVNKLTSPSAAPLSAPTPNGAIMGATPAKSIAGASIQRLDQNRNFGKAEQAVVREEFTPFTNELDKDVSKQSNVAPPPNATSAEAAHAVTKNSEARAAFDLHAQAAKTAAWAAKPHDALAKAADDYRRTEVNRAPLPKPLEKQAPEQKAAAAGPDGSPVAVAPKPVRPPPSAAAAAVSKTGGEFVASTRSINPPSPPAKAQNVTGWQEFLNAPAVRPMSGNQGNTVAVATRRLGQVSKRRLHAADGTSIGVDVRGVGTPTLAAIQRSSVATAAAKTAANPAQEVRRVTVANYIAVGTPLNQVEQAFRQVKMQRPASTSQASPLKRMTEKVATLAANAQLATPIKEATAQAQYRTPEIAPVQQAKSQPVQAAMKTPPRVAVSLAKVRDASFAEAEPPKLARQELKPAPQKDASFGDVEPPKVEQKKTPQNMIEQKTIMIPHFKTVPLETQLAAANVAKAAARVQLTVQPRRREELAASTRNSAASAGRGGPSRSSAPSPGKS